jgi:hypothetical protein
MLIGSVLMPFSAKASEVNIISNCSYIDSGGNYHLLGEVQNTGSQPQSNVKITSVFYSSNGTIVESSFTFSKLGVLDAGDKSPFEMILSEENIMSQVDHYTLTLDYKPGTALPATLKIISNNAIVDRSGFLRVAGEIQNMGNTNATYVEVIGTFYNSDGNVVDESYGVSQPSNLQPGQKGYYNIILYDNSRISLVNRYILTAQSIEYSLISDIYLTPAPDINKLSIVSAHDDPTPSVGIRTYTSGSLVTCRVSSPVTEDNSVWICTGWTGTGSVPTSGTDTSTTFTISADSSITWNWKSDTNNLTIISAHDDPTPSVGIRTYTSGSLVTCRVSSPVTEDNSVWTCTGWTGTGSVPTSGTDTSTTFTISADSSITWNWKPTIIPTPTISPTPSPTHISPTPTPTVKPTTTPTPTQIPTLTSSTTITHPPSITPTSTPQISELPLWICFALFLAVITQTLIFVRKMKSKNK